MKKYVLYIFLLFILQLSLAYAVDIRLTDIEKITGDVHFPVALCYLDKHTLLFTEKEGLIRVIKNGILQKDPLKRFNVTTGFERGLLGIACKDKKIYVYYTYTSGLKPYNRVVSLFPERVILDKIPGAIIHNGGILTFGSDGKLYISTGDARDGDLSQDIKSLAGKILRMNPDGTIPEDNPYKGSPVWSLGHRNIFGMAFDEKGDLYITENGTNRDDEINVIDKGKNYGWPIVLGYSSDKGFVNPLKTYTPNIAPTNGTFYKDWFIFGTWNTGEIIALKIKDRSVVREKVLHKHRKGITDVKFLPDGFIYFLTRDGIYRARIMD
ncbi:MAG: PQQ-dependent sugar dehydrogenase [Thermodesulfovibrionales bacterium]|nr:PQQ-dependent sugar dehydrogenase [Thermodesulfovibrionales bacterium]